MWLTADMDMMLRLMLRGLPVRSSSPTEAVWAQHQVPYVQSSSSPAPISGYGSPLPSCSFLSANSPQPQWRPASSASYASRPTVCQTALWLSLPRSGNTPVVSRMLEPHLLRSIQFQQNETLPSRCRTVSGASPYVCPTSIELHHYTPQPMLVI